MLGEYELKTISNIIMLALWRNKLKPSLLSFHFSQGFFFSLSLSIFLIKLPYILKRAKEKQNHIFVCFDAVVKWSCCVANKEKKQ